MEFQEQTSTENSQVQIKFVNSWKIYAEFLNSDILRGLIEKFSYTNFLDSTEFLQLHLGIHRRVL